MNTSSIATFAAMGTLNTVTLFNCRNGDILPRIFQYVKESERKLTVHQSDSEVTAINRNAGIRAVKVSPSVFLLIRYALTASLQPGAGFNFTIGPLTRLWRRYRVRQILPKTAEILTALSLIDPHEVVLNAAESSVFLRRKGMSLDLGAIAKGFIADGVKRLLIDEGIEQAIIDLGGNIVLLGESPDRQGGYWRVGIQKPYAVKGEYIGTVGLKNRSVVTSGIYERYAEIGNRRYHHIINAETGYPFENDWVSVTVIADGSVDGEIYSTMAYAKERDAAIDFIAGRTDIGGILIDKENRLFISKNVIPFFSLKDAGYQVVAV